nr:EOG090X0CBU [Lepidurus arcticus]
MENYPSMHESEVGFECFHNYTASEVFVQGLAGLVNQEDVEAIIKAQKHMLQRFEKTNEMLINCNALSAGHLQKANQDFKKHAQLLLDTRKDLENIFRRVRTLKSKLATQYPQAFAVAASQVPVLEVDEEGEQHATPSTSRARNN